MRSSRKGTPGLLSFVLKGDQRRAARVIDRLKVFQIGCSWGGFESLALCPLMEYTGEQLSFWGWMKASGIDQALLRAGRSRCAD